MMQAIAAYGITAVVFAGIDAIWLGLVATSFYRAQLGPMMRQTPDLGVAALFYAIYVAGIVLFAVLPGLRAGSWVTALMLGAALGLVAYGTYDLTNLATLVGWPVTMSLVDLAWGIVLTGLSAGGATYLLLRFAPGIAGTG